MAHGVAVVATDVGGMGEQIENRVSVAPPINAPPRPVERASPRQQGVSGILSGGHTRNLPPQHLRPTYIDDVEPEPQAYHEPQYQPAPEEQAWAEQPQAYYQPAPSAALMSPNAAYAAQNSFQALADSLMAGMGGEVQLQDMAQNMLRPMLKQWLDDNLPPLVEKLVREEIERVARRGR